MRHRRLSLATLVALAAVPACMDLDDAELTDDDLATAAEPISGGVFGPGSLAGILRVTVAGQSDVHTGLLLSPDLVVTSNRWIGWSTTPSSITSTSGQQGPSPQVRAGRFVNNTWYFPASITQVAPYTAGHVNTSAIDGRASANLVGLLVRCYEYDGNALEYIDAYITAASGDDLSLAPAWFGSFDDSDAGAVCLDLQAGTAVAMVTGKAAGVAHATRYAPMRTWFDGIRNLASTRSDSRSTHLALYTRAPDGTRMCLNIPWGSPYEHEPINAYPCPAAPTPAEHFWLDVRVDSGRPRLVSHSSGRCADVPSGSTLSGTNLQQFGCHNGLNQRLELSIWADATGGWKIRPAHAPAQNLCLSVEGGPRNTSAPTEQRTCTGSLDQRWYPIWL